ncbi:MAG: hypothetical protein OXU31_06980 [Gammaproteobacteria bacterium]|nr:hypothetical protein [Gammaproteobacteria bacterium]
MSLSAPTATLLHGDVLDVLPGLAGRDYGAENKLTATRKRKG